MLGFFHLISMFLVCTTAQITRKKHGVDKNWHKWFGKCNTTPYEDCTSTSPVALESWKRQSPEYFSSIYPRPTPTLEWGRDKVEQEKQLCSPYVKPGFTSTCVIGQATNYPWKKLRTIIVSARTSGYRGDMVFFVRKGLKDMFPTVYEQGQRLKIHFIEIDNFWPFHVELQSHIDLSGLDRTVKEKIKFNGTNSDGKKARQPFQFMRMLYTSAYLKACGHLYNKILSLDTRDVIFQGDPFPDLPRSRAYIFHENRAIHTEKHNGNWIKTGWPTIAGSTNGKCILNSGTLGGGPQEVVYLMKLILGAVSFRGAYTRDGGKYDQGALNAAVWGYDHINEYQSGLVKKDIVVINATSHTSPLINLTWMTKKQFGFDTRKNVVFLYVSAESQETKQIIPKVVHMLDRHEEYWNAYLSALSVYD